MGLRDQGTFTGSGKYDSNRDAKTGHFRKGHTLRTGVDGAAHAKFARVKSMWLECADKTDVEKVWNELVAMCLSDKTPPDVKLKSLVYCLDRLWGRPQENIQLDVTGAPTDALVDLSKDELLILQRVVGRSQNSKEVVAEETINVEPESVPALAAPSTPSAD